MYSLKIIIPGRALNELNKILEDNEEIMKIAAATGSCCIQYWRYNSIFKAPRRSIL